MSAALKQSVQASWAVTAATEADWPGIWEIFHDVVQGGDTYSYAADTTEAQAKDLWIGAGKYGTGALAYVVKDGEKVVGTYSLRRNHYGHGAHVANAGYMVHKDYRGRGVARAMCKHSLEEAKRQGCLSMQFNYVVSTNAPAVALYRKLGFAVVGTLPEAFRHRTLGLVDVFVMHRFL